MISLDQQQRRRIIDDILRRDLQEDFHAGDLLGYDPEEYQRIIDSAEQGPLATATELGWSIIASENTGDRHLVLTRPANVGRVNSGAAARIIEILATVTPENNGLLLAFSSAPASALFRPLQNLECGLAVLINPQGLGFSAAPAADWQPITGGWKKGSLIAAADSFFLTTDNPSGSPELGGQMKLTTSGKKRIIEQLTALTAEHWPLGSELSAERQAQLAALNTVQQINELIADYRDYRAEYRRDIADLRYELENDREDLVYQQEDLADLRASLQRAESDAQRLITEIGQQERELRSKENNLQLDLRHKFLTTLQFTEQLAQIESLPEVTSAEIAEPFGLDGSSGQLIIKAEIISGQTETIVVGAEQITVNGRPCQQLEARSLALAEKFAAGTWVELSRMIIGALRS
jgi:hypothetical protein